MDIIEATKLLAIIQSAYPSHFKNLNNTEVEGVSSLWQSHFADIPAALVFEAVNKHIARSAFAPAISDIKTELRSIHLEAIETMTSMFGDVTPQELAKAERIDRLLSGYEQNQRRLPG